MTFTKKELEMIVSCLEIMKIRMKKLLKDSQQVGAGEKEIKQAFLQIDTLIARVQSE